LVNRKGIPAVLDNFSGLDLTHFDRGVKNFMVSYEGVSGKSAMCTKPGMFLRHGDRLNLFLLI